MRSGHFDPLEPSKEPRWYIVRTMTGKLLESRQLPPGTHLKRAFIASMLEWIDAGWDIAEFKSRTGVFFPAKGVERRQVEITPSDPGRAPRL